MELIRQGTQRLAQEVSVNTTPKETSGEKPLRVRRGRVDSVDLYEIKDNELDLLEKGAPINIYLNFSIFLISIAFTALAALWTAEKFKYPIAETFFVVTIIVGLLMGGFLLILWYRGRSSVSEVIKGIRNRIPPEEHLTSTVAAPPKASGKEEEPQAIEPKD